MKKSNKKDRINIILLYAVLSIILTAIAYSAFSKMLIIKVASVKKKGIEWNVGFIEENIDAFTGGTSNTGRICGAAKATKESVTLSNITLSKPGDSCVYPIRIANNGTIPAKISNITLTFPNNVNCIINSGKMECGNITYSLSLDANGTEIVDVEDKILVNNTKLVYLVSKYTSNQLVNNAIVHSGTMFTINYVQA